MIKIMKIRNILLIVLLFGSFTNCKDFLEEENKSDVLSDEIYRTADGYENLVKSTYASLRNLYHQPWLFMAGTDMYVEGRNPQPEGISEYRTLSSTEASVEIFYRDCYRGIQLCNVALEYNSETVQTATTAVRKGEVQFLRAYYYFLLAQSFGGVSLITETINTPTVAFERQNAETIYTFVITEMESALALLTGATGQEFGRVTARAVKHYLAKAYLTRGYEPFARSDDFAKAAAYADEAIAGYNLSSISYKDLFLPGKENNNEILFSIQYATSSLANPTGGSVQNFYFGPYMGGEGAKFGYPYKSYTLLPTTYVYKLFNQNDLRWEGSFMNVVYERYYDYYDKSAADQARLNVRFYYPQAWQSDAASIAAWRAADPTRRNATQVIPFNEVSPGLCTWERDVNVDNNTPSVRKFDDPTAVFAAATAAPTDLKNVIIGNGGGTSTRDIFIARLAETYLIAAEAYVKLNNPGLAMERVNAVRKRAEKTPGTLVLTNPALVNIDLILDERARELIGEYDRWFDLKRTGTLKERTKKYNKDIRALFETVGDPFVGTGGADKILRPIPQTAIDLNQNEEFAQNPGY
jgi:hypothetical protein